MSRRRRGLFSGGAGGRGGVGLSAAALAPMVDMMTILVVAVLRTWSTEPPVTIPGEPDFALPLSAQETPVNKGVTVDVGLEGLYVNGRRAGSAAFWRDREEVLITDLHDVLSPHRGEPGDHPGPPAGAVVAGRKGALHRATGRVRRRGAGGRQPRLALSDGSLSGLLPEVRSASVESLALLIRTREPSPRKPHRIRWRRR